MRTVSFVNPNFQQGPKEARAYFLPYSTGIIWQYAQQSPQVAKKFKLGEFIWQREPHEDVLSRIAQHDIVAFSTYIWNKNYNYQLAQSIKKINPNCLIIFGGPEPPISREDIFQIYPYIDIVVKLEGEYAFRDILERFESRDFEAVSGLLLNKDTRCHDTGPAQRVRDLDAVPSPYTSRLFDKIIDDNPDVSWNAIFETNRGCPYQCTFCDWGSLTYNKITKFGLDRLFAELEWMAEKKISYLVIADANFGIFPERDMMIAEKLIEVQQATGYPQQYYVNWAKNQKPEVFEIVKKLVNHGLRSGLVVSVQTLTTEVLDNIKRKNMGINSIEDIYRRCDRENIPVVTELILGLPGETLQSWKENFWRLFRAGNHTGISIYVSEMLENAEMNLRQKQLYRIETMTSTDYMSNTGLTDPYPESIEVVRSTRDLPAHDMLEALVFNYFITTMHINGASTMVARFAHAMGIDYSEFYTKLYDYLSQDEWWAKEFDDARYYHNQWLQTGSVEHPLIGGVVPIYGVTLNQRTSMALQVHDQWDHFFDLLRKFCSQFKVLLPYLESIFEVQTNYQIQWKNISNYPRRIDLDHDVLGLIQYGNTLDQPASYQFDWPEPHDMSLQRFCENYWFGRRRNFSKAVITRMCD